MIGLASEAPRVTMGTVITPAPATLCVQTAAPRVLAPLPYACAHGTARPWPLAQNWFQPYLARGPPLVLPVPDDASPRSHLAARAFLSGGR